MAKKVFYQLVDDLDGSTIDDGAGETVTFALDGSTFEIDLTSSNAAELRGALARYVDAARLTSRGRKTGNRRSGSGAGSGRDLAAIRSWAAANGHTVADRGRIPGAVIDAYDAAKS